MVALFAMKSTFLPMSNPKRMLCWSSVYTLLKSYKLQLLILWVLICCLQANIMAATDTDKVLSPPVISAPKTAICPGEELTLTATGCEGGTYEWTDGKTGDNITIKPSKTRSYRAVCSSMGMVSDSSTAFTVTVTVNTAPSLTSQSNITKTWDKTIEGHYQDFLSSIINTTDGGYLMACKASSSENYYLWLVKLDATGSIIWSREINESSNRFPVYNYKVAIANTPDGGYLIGTKAFNASMTGTVFDLIKVNANGEVQQESMISPDENWKVSSFNSIIPTINNDGFLLGGVVNQNNTSNSKLWVVKIDNHYNRVSSWNNEVYGDNNYYVKSGESFYASTIVATSDGYILGGTVDASSVFNEVVEYDYGVIKIDKNLTKQWEKKFSKNNFDFLTSLVSTTDGKILVGGYTYGTGNPKFWVIQLDSQGNINTDFDKTFGGDGSDKLLKILKTPDGGFLLGGTSTSTISGDKSEANQGSLDYWLVKLDNLGKKLWDKTLGGNGSDEFRDMLLSPEGDFVIGGYSASSQSGDKSSNNPFSSSSNRSSWLVKIAEDKSNLKLTAQGCIGTVNWSTGEKSTSIIVAATNKTYTATCQTTNCTSEEASLTIVVPSKPVAPAISSSVAGNTICVGGSVTLSSSCEYGTLTWSTEQNTSSITVSPTKTTTYSVQCTQNGVSSDASAVTITVNPIPQAPTLLAAQDTICSGTSTALSASGCDGTITWSDKQIGKSITVSLTQTTTYTATCTVRNCVSPVSNSLTITVNPVPPTPEVSASARVICYNESVTLSASGCSGNVVWSGAGNLYKGTPVIPLKATTTFAATCYSKECVSLPSKSIKITVNGKLNAPSLSADKTDLCYNDTTTIKALGCTQTLQWFKDGKRYYKTGNSFNTGVLKKDVVFSAICTDKDSCSKSDTVSITVKVKDKIEVQVIAVDETVCYNGSTAIKALGCTKTIKWFKDGKDTTLSAMSFNTGVLKKDVVFEAICTDGCSKSDTARITIKVSPEIVAPKLQSALKGSDLCYNSSTKLTGTCTNSTIQWLTGERTDTITVKPLITTTYKAICIGADKCSKSDIVSITIKVKSEIKTPFLVADTIACYNDTKIVQAIGCTQTLQWFKDGKRYYKTGNSFNTGVLKKDVVFSAICTDGCSKSDTARITIKVNPEIKTPSLTADKIVVCYNDSTTVTATGCTQTLQWFKDGKRYYKTGNSFNTGVLKKDVVFSAICTDKDSCSKSDMASITIKVNPEIKTPSLTADKIVVCYNDSTTVTATGCTQTLQWFKDGKRYYKTGNSFNTGVLKKDVVFSVICTDKDSCSKSDMASITIKVKPEIKTPTLTADTIACYNETKIVQATGCTQTIQWFKDGKRYYKTGNSFNTGVLKKDVVFSVICTDKDSCSKSDMASITIKVKDKIEVQVIAVDDTVCYNGSTAIKALGCTKTIKWFKDGKDTTLSAMSFNTGVLKKDVVFSAICTDGCSKSDIARITIKVKPEIVAPKLESALKESDLCYNSSTTLTGTCTKDNGTIQWSTGDTTKIITIKPLVKTTYTAYCIGADNCSKSDIASITIKVKSEIKTPFLVADTIACYNETKIVQAIGCTQTIRWFKDGVATQLDKSFNTGVLKKDVVFSAICTDGCSNSDTARIKIKVKSEIVAPTLKSTLEKDSSLCYNSSTTLTGSCTNSTIQWSTGETNSTITVTPLINTTYTAICIGADKCSKSDMKSITIKVKDKIDKPTLKANTIVCYNDTTTVIATGCTQTLQWFKDGKRYYKTGKSFNTGVLKKDVVFEAICADKDSCSKSDAVSITINVKPEIKTPLLTADKIVVCYNDSTTVQALGCTQTLQWFKDGKRYYKTGDRLNTGALKKDVVFEAICTDKDSCSKSDMATNITIKVKDKINAPAFNLTDKTTLCYNDADTIVITNNNLYTIHWLDSSSIRSSTRMITKDSSKVQTTIYKAYFSLEHENKLVCLSDITPTTITVKAKIPETKVLQIRDVTNTYITEPTSLNQMTSVVAIEGDGFLLGGQSSSSMVKSTKDTVKTQENKGGLDYWIIKTDKYGKRQWDKTFGGKANDNLTCMLKLSDGYLLGGYSNSNLADDKTDGSKGGADYWVIKIDNKGNKIWDKTFGGSGNDYLQTMLSPDDGKTIFLGGTSNSKADSDKSANSNGGADYWVIKIDNKGNKKWDKTIGDANENIFAAMAFTSDKKAIVLAGSSLSSKGFDYFLCKIDTIRTSTKLDSVTFNKATNDYVSSILALNDKTFLIGGTASTSADVNSFRVIKIGEDLQPIKDVTLSIDKNTNNVLSAMIPTRDGVLLGGRTFDAKKNKFKFGIANINTEQQSLGDTIWTKTFEAGSKDAILLSMAPIDDTNKVLLGGYTIDAQNQTSYWTQITPLCKSPEVLLEAVGCPGTIEKWYQDGTEVKSIISNNTKNLRVNIQKTKTVFKVDCKYDECTKYAKDNKSLDSVTVNNTLPIIIKPTAITAATDTTKGQTAVSTRIDVNLSLLQESTYLVFPNPANEVLRVMTTLQGPTHFVLFDVLGNKVLEETFESQLQIPIKHLDKGNYFYQITNQEKASTGRVQILH